MPLRRESYARLQDPTAVSFPVYVPGALPPGWTYDVMWSGPIDEEEAVVFIEPDRGASTTDSLWAVMWQTPTQRPDAASDRPGAREVVVRPGVVGWLVEAEPPLPPQHNLGLQLPGPTWIEMNTTAGEAFLLEVAASLRTAPTTPG